MISRDNAEMHVLLFSPIPYHFLHQRPQKIADYLRRRGFSVTYVEPDVWKDYFSMKKRGFMKALVFSFVFHARGLFRLVWKRRSESRRGRRMQQGEIRIATLPLTVPINKSSSFFLDVLNAAVFREFLLRNVLSESAGSGECVAIVQHPFWGSVVQRQDFFRLFYDCIDELRIFVGRNSMDRFVRYERNLVEMADGIFVTAKKLEERLARIRSDVPLYRIPNGVDADWFESRINGVPVPDDLREIKRPIVGYVGALYVWLDYELLEYVATRLPEVSFVLVGPREYPGVLDRVLSRPNCHWLGMKRYNEIPSYIQAFDVCMIPFAVGDISKSTNPVKLFEYFALGKPVVTSPLDELMPYRKDNLVYWAENAGDFVTCVSKALSESDDRRTALRKAVARNNSWDDRVGAMVTAMTVSG